MPDRSHQAALKLVLDEVEASSFPLDILVDAVPGGGKSRLPGIICEKFPHFQLAWFVPRKALARQAAKGMARDFHIDIREALPSDYQPSRGSRGFVATHAALTECPSLWVQELSRRDHIVVIDELHHAKCERTGECNQLATAIKMLPFKIRLCMTGTLETNDNTLIQNVPYRLTRDGYALDLENFNGLVIRYTRQEALAEKAIIPIEFHHHDGPVRWEDGEGIKNHTLSEVPQNDARQAVWTALRTDMASSLFENGVTHWRANGRKLLVVACDQSEAREYHRRLTRSNINAGLAISQEDESAYRDIEAFESPVMNALVTCQMAYEGLDVPEITHIVCLTHIRSVPWIEQMLARAWRYIPGKSKCWAHVPNDPLMNSVIERIRVEQDRTIPVFTESESNGGNGGTKNSAFVPISSELESVRAQLLDGSLEEDDAQHEVFQICDKVGLPHTDPIVVQFLSRLRTVRENQPTRVRTIREQEEGIRKQIARTCRFADYEKQMPPGTHQKRLFEAMGNRSIKRMTIEELERARSKTAHICS